MQSDDVWAAIPVYVEALNDEKIPICRYLLVSVLHEIASALGRLGPAGPEAVPPLLHMFREREPSHREQIYLAMNQTNDKSSIISAYYSMKGSARLRLMIVVILKTIGSTPVPVLVDLLRDSRIRRHAADALADFGSAAFDELSRAIREDHDPDVRTFATESLRAGMGLDPKQLYQDFAMCYLIDQPATFPVKLYVEACSRLRQLKVFYLVFRVYKEGVKSLRKASEKLIEHNEANLTHDDMPFTNVSFSNNLEDKQLAAFFSETLDIRGFTMLFKPMRYKEKLPAQFTDNASRAFVWTDAFLTLHLSPDWYGFSRLTPEQPSK